MCLLDAYISHETPSMHTPPLLLSTICGVSGGMRLLWVIHGAPVLLLSRLIFVFAHTPRHISELCDIQRTWLGLNVQHATLLNQDGVYVRGNCCLHRKPRGRSGQTYVSFRIPSQQTACDLHTYRWWVCVLVSDLFSRRQVEKLLVY